MTAGARDEEDKPGAQAIKAMRRPSPAAWAVNVVARERPHEVARLAVLGAELAEAQSEGSGADLRRLAKLRHETVAALLRDARRLAADRGHPLSSSVERQAEETLNAAVADPAAAAAVASGRLVHSLLHSGIGDLDLEGAVAGPAPDPDRRVPPRDDLAERRTERERERARLADLRETAATAASDLDAAERMLERAEQETASAADAYSELEDRLAAARQQLEDANARVHEATQARNSARRAAAAAARKLDAGPGSRSS